MPQRRFRRPFLLAALAAPAVLAAGPQEDALATARRHLQAWRDSLQPALADDWGQLGRYREANAKLGAPGALEERVVFLGDSITDGWDLEASFPHRPYVNRGISGQTTSQMLVRFRQDVVRLRPRVVVILAGTNDLAGNTGPMALEDIVANLASMADLARANGIRPILCSVLPVNDFTEAARDFFLQRPPERILALNRGLAAHCADHGLAYLDLFAATVDGRGFLKRELADDGLHPNAAGYRVLAPLVEAAVRKALGRPEKNY